jgi:hypothetical protein
MYNLGISSISSNSVNKCIIPINIGTAFGEAQNNIGSLDGFLGHQSILELEASQSSQALLQ